MHLLIDDHMRLMKLLQVMKATAPHGPVHHLPALMRLCARCSLRFSKRVLTELAPGRVAANLVSALATHGTLKKTFVAFNYDFSVLCWPPTRWLTVYSLTGCPAPPACGTIEEDLNALE